MADVLTYRGFNDIELELGSGLQDFLPLAHVATSMDVLHGDLVALRLFHQLSENEPIGAKRNFLDDNVGKGEVHRLNIVIVDVATDCASCCIT